MNPKRTPFRISNEERKGVLFLLLVLCVVKSLESFLTLGYHRIVFDPNRFENYSSESKLFDSLNSNERQPAVRTMKRKVSMNSLVKQDLNNASVSDLRQIRGVGPILSKRIIKYGRSLNGYTNINQLYRVYGLDSLIVDRMKKVYKIKADTIKPINIRVVSREELNTLPYLSPQEIEWLIILRNRPEGLGSKEFVTNLFLKTLNKNKKLLVYLTY